MPAPIKALPNTRKPRAKKKTVHGAASNPGEQPAQKQSSEKKHEAVSFQGEQGLLIEAVFTRKSSAPLSFAVSERGRACDGLFAFYQLPDGTKLTPPSDPTGLIEKGVVILPSWTTPFRSHQQLVSELCALIHRYADAPALWEELIAHYVLMTWVYDRFTAVPYLRFQGEPQTGKTRLLLIAAHLSYKAILAGGATTASPMFRLLDIYHGTFVIDEADYRNSDLWSEIIKILNNGYMRGLFVLRSEQTGNSYEPIAFDVYGPKILSTRKTFADHALETRCITLTTQERTVRADVPRQLPQSFFKEAETLRNKLLAWRFANWATIEPDESSLLSLEPRLAQIGAPILAVCRDEGFQNRFIEFLTQHAEEQRADRPQALVVEAIRLMQGRRTDGRFRVKEVADKAQLLAGPLGVETNFTPKHVGHLIRSLGIETRRTGDGYEFFVTKEKLSELEGRYQRAASTK